MSRLGSTALVGLLMLLQSCAGWEPGMDGNQKGRSYHDSPAAQVTIDKFIEVDPNINSFVNEAYAMIVLPKIAKGGLMFGGAHGKGLLYVKGKLNGNASLTQLSWGLQAGWQKYRQLIFFKDKQKLTNAMASSAEFSAQLSGAMASLGAAATTDYKKGVAVFILPIGGGMAEMSIAGQQLSIEMF